MTALGRRNGVCRRTEFVEEVRSGSSYISSNHLRLHFGLGSRRQVGRIEVRWPNGKREVFPGGDADRFVTLMEAEVSRPTAREVLV
jgi:hypothetical protein